jgi:hypothetical protein
MSTENHGGITSTENFQFVHRDSFAILPAKSSGSKWEEQAKGMMNWKWFLANDFTSPLKEGMLQISIALKNPSLWPGLNLQTLGVQVSPAIVRFT